MGKDAFGHIENGEMLGRSFKKRRAKLEKHNEIKLSEKPEAPQTKQMQNKVSRTLLVIVDSRDTHVHTF